MSENKITFDDFDKFNRKDFANRLTSVITKFYPFFNEAFVLSLNAKFGSGKTTFLKMWKELLESQEHTVIYLNAWENDFDEDPLISIISTLLPEIGTGKKISNAFKVTLGAAAITVNQILRHNTGIDIDETGQRIEADKKDLIKIGSEIYAAHSYKQQAYKTLKEELSDYIGKIQKKPLIIFVDELDRVRPDYAVSFLEAIKHIFSVQGICFVIAVDRKQLEISVKNLYGDLDFENYYLRFITREAQLPSIKLENINSFINQKAKEFFELKIESQIYFPFSKDEQKSILDFMSIICISFDFAPRQIESFFRIFSQFMAISEPNERRKIEWINASTLLIALFLDNRGLYRRTGQGILKPEELYKYISDQIQDKFLSKSSHRLLIFRSMTYLINENNKMDVFSVLIKYDPKLVNTSGEGAQEAINSFLQSLVRPVNDFGEIHEISVFQEMYRLLEDWKSFLQL